MASAANVQQVAQITTEQTYSGPIPPAAEMERYYNLAPNYADRIIQMAESEGHHRRELERKSLEANIENSGKEATAQKLGQIFGFGIGLAGLWCAAYLGSLGAHDAASIVGGTTVVGLVGIFVTGKLISKKEKD